MDLLTRYRRHVWRVMLLEEAACACFKLLNIRYFQHDVELVAHLAASCTLIAWDYQDTEFSIQYLDTKRNLEVATVGSTSVVGFAPCCPASPRLPNAVRGRTACANLPELAGVGQVGARAAQVNTHGDLSPHGQMAHT